MTPNSQSRKKGEGNEYLNKPINFYSSSKDMLSQQ
jgi:hypothetical protein